MDSRIGFYNETGRRVLPEKTIGGAPVTRPVTSTMALDDTGKYFVVLDAQRVRGFSDILAALKAEVAARTAPAAETVPEEALPLPDTGSTVKRGRNAG